MADKWKLSLCLGLAYFATGSIGLWLPMFGSSITLIWLPTGISVGMLYRYGFGCWPGIIIGALITNLSTGLPVVVAFGIAVGNTVAPMLATYLLFRMRFDRAFERPREIFLLAIAAAFGMTASATLGVISLSLAGLMSQDQLRAWLTWWVGDTMGVIAAAPLVMVLTRKEIRLLAKKRIEFLSWLVTALILSFFVFVWNPSETKAAEALALFPLPLMVWAAMRFGATGTSVGVIIFAFGAAIGVARQEGPFAGSSPAEGVLLLWIYMFICAAIGWLGRILDVSQRQSASLQRLLERAMNDASLGVLLSNPEGHVLYVNQGFERLTGYPPDEILGQSGRLLQGPETDPATIRELEAAIRDKVSFSGEILNYRKDGTTFWSALQFSPVHGESGEIHGFLGVQQDVTARRTTQLALAQSEERLRTMLDMEPECVKVVSRYGRVIEINTAGLRMIEADTLDQVIGEEFQKLVSPEDRLRYLAMHRQVIEHGESRKCEFALIGLKGKRRWLESNAVPYRDDRGDIIGRLSVVRDLTERKLAELALQESELRFRTLTNHAPVGIFTTDEKGDCNFVNSRWLKIAGLSNDQAMGSGWKDVLHAADRERVIAEWQNCVNTGSEFTSNFRFARQDGEDSWVYGTASSLRDEQGSVKGYVGTITDLTELLQAKEVLRASLSEKEAMLKEIHHRVKNNLQIVTSLLDLQAMGDTNSKTAGLLRESRNRVRSMALVHETLYGTKDLGKIQLSEYLDQLCSHLFRSYGIDPSKVRLEVQIAEVSLKLDRAIPFGLIVNELISNALKYAFPEGRQGRIGLSVQPLLEHCFELRVTDDGVGLPDTFDIKNLKSLGLHLVRDLMIQLEGSLSYSGEAGTDFRMTFPMDDPA